METVLLLDMLVVFGLAILVTLGCHRVGVPPIVGFLITGVIAGPTGLGLVHNPHEVEFMAEVGVILLLFTIGMEFSVAELARLKRAVLGGGSLQVLLTGAAAAGAGLAWGLGAGPAVFLGCILALSSTAIVLGALQQRAELESTHGRMALSMLIFQDVIVAPMVLLVPFMAGAAGDPWAALGGTALKGLVVVALAVGASRWLVPPLLRAVLKVRSRELFLLTVLAGCLGVALLTSHLGLSLSLGAFLAGLVMSESEYAHHALEGVLPFKDVFTSLFFVSMGMLLDTGYFAAHLPLVLAVAGAVLVVKTLAAAGASLAVGYSLRTALMAGLALCQVGEFSFILAKEGMAYGLMGTSGYQLFLAASVLTMALTPFLIRLAPVVGDLAARGAPAPVTEAPSGLSDHLIVVGFGFGGRRLAKAARAAGIDYTVIEANAETVREQARQGEPISHGDATHQAVLDAAGVGRARVLAVMVPDASAARRITELAHAVSRDSNPALHIVVRTRFVSETEPLRALGAVEVICEEHEAAVEVFNRVLAHYLVPRGEIERLAEGLRAGAYELLRGEGQACVLGDLKRGLPGMELAVVQVGQGSAMDGAALSEGALRRAGVMVTAVLKGDEIISPPGADLRLGQGDTAYLFGRRDDVVKAAGLFRADKG